MSYRGSYVFCCLTIFSGVLEADVHTLWDKYLSIYESKEKNQDYDDRHVRVIGEWANIPGRVFGYWPLRDYTYEIFAKESSKLARCIYGAALFTKDINKSISLEKFEKGVSGFHYTTVQIAQWANTLLKGKFTLNTKQELIFLAWLLEDNVLTLKDGEIVTGNKVSHIMGASPGRKRSFELNMIHERLHVFWDEDGIYRKKEKNAWTLLSNEEKQAVFDNLKMYDQNNIESIIEEWAVRKNEATPPW